MPAPASPKISSEPRSSRRSQGVAPGVTGWGWPSSGWTGSHGFNGAGWVSIFNSCRRDPPGAPRACHQRSGSRTFLSKATRSCSALERGRGRGNATPRRWRSRCNWGKSCSRSGPGRTWIAWRAKNGGSESGIPFAEGIVAFSTSTGMIGMLCANANWISIRLIFLHPQIAFVPVRPNDDQHHLRNGELLANHTRPIVSTMEEVGIHEDHVRRGLPARACLAAIHRCDRYSQWRRRVGSREEHSRTPHGKAGGYRIV